MRRPALLLCLLCVTVCAAAQNAALNVPALLERTDVQAAFAALDRDHDRFVRELVELTEIPAPPFKEEVRAKAFYAKFRELGLRNVEIDAEGNVIGHRPGTGGGPNLVLAAHLDTVFPEGTDVRVKKEGTRYSAPGIGDDTHGLATLLAFIRALDAAQIRTKGDLIFVGDVGEEGLGNLRGVRYLFEKGPLKGRIQNFISLDGSDDSAIVTGGVASRRYRVTFQGPGGHSYGAFGMVSPSLAMGNAVARFSRTKVPQRPKTTFNVGVYGGGTSVNAIPHTVWMEVDMRSESPEELAKLENKFLADVRTAVAVENRTRGIQSGRITVKPELVGDRKGGQTPATARLVQAAVAVSIAMNLTPRLTYSSTDANIPIGLGIPAITIGSGRGGRNAHALNESVSVDKADTLPAQRRALAVTLAIVGIE
jgi:acetylornithine deacetylase/succinyl-diaminopimelate desuccinylase-like protein